MEIFLRDFSMSQGSVLVTGGCGYIGSHVVRQLSEKGFRVIVFDNLSTGFRESLIHNETLIVGDLNDRFALNSLFSRFKFDAVMHFAASIVVPESVSNPIKYYSNNTVNTINLIEASQRVGVRKIVFSSTAAVYGESPDTVTESSPTNPANPYAKSKLMSEQVLIDVGKSHSEIGFVILRYFNVAGADPQGRIGQRFPNATHLIKVACEAALGIREKITIFGTDYPTEDGTCIRDYVHVEDLASAHLKALEYLLKDGRSITLNCGYGRGFSVREVLNTVEKVHGSKISVQEGPRRCGDISTIVANSRKVREVLEWLPEYDNLYDVVGSAYQWEKKLLIGQEKRRLISSEATSNP